MAAGHEKGGEKVTRTAPGIESASGTRRRAKTRSRYATAPAGGSSAISTVAVSPARTKLASVNANWRGRPLARSYQATRTNASRTSGSLTSSVARNPARPAGTGTSPLSMPRARPPGTPTTSCGPSAPNDPRGVVRRYGGPPSALADRPTTAIATSPITSETRFFDMPETVLDGPVRVCPQFVRSRRTFVRKPSHICAAPPSGELHDPGRDLIGREMGLRDASINVQRSRGSDHVKPVV